MGFAIRAGIGGAFIAIGLFTMLLFDIAFVWPDDKLILQFMVGFGWLGWGISVWIMELVLESWQDSIAQMREQRDKWRHDVMRLKSLV